MNEARLFFTEFVPDSAQWAAGARWVRCDIGMIAFGSKYDDPALQNLPSIASIRRSIETNPETFVHCSNDPQGPNAGPYSKDAVWANCEKDPEWMHVDGFQAPLDASHDYPSQAAMTAIYVNRCEDAWTNATHITFAYYPTRADWDNGDEAIECWVGRK